MLVVRSNIWLCSEADVRIKFRMVEMGGFLPVRLGTAMGETGHSVHSLIGPTPA
jgi:hypothetical protein